MSLRWAPHLPDDAAQFAKGPLSYTGTQPIKLVEEPLPVSYRLEIHPLLPPALSDVPQKMVLSIPGQCHGDNCTPRKCSKNTVRCTGRGTDPHSYRRCCNAFSRRPCRSAMRTSHAVARATCTPVHQPPAPSNAATMVAYLLSLSRFWASGHFAFFGLAFPLRDSLTGLRFFVYVRLALLALLGVTVDVGESLAV